MFFGEDPKKFSKRNVAMGRKTAAAGDARRAEFAKMLQETKNYGVTNVANIRQEGADRRLAVERTPTEAESFYQGLASKYGESFMKKDLGEEFLPEEKDQPTGPPRAQVWRPSLGESKPIGLEPKFDVSNYKSPFGMMRDSETRERFPWERPVGEGTSGSFEALNFDDREPSIYDRFKSLFSKKKKRVASFGIAGVRG